MKETWEEIKNQIGSEIPKNTFSLWIKPIDFLSHDNGSIYLSCPNKFSKNWVVENFSRIILERFRRLAGSDLEIIYKVANNRKRDAVPPSLTEKRQLILPNLSVEQKENGSFLKRDFTFERFIVGPSNEFAYSASNALAQGSSCHYNTLLMLSPTGLGKAHLSQAVGNKIKEKNPGTRVVYMTAEDFTNEMIFSLKSNRIEEFKKRYRRSCDVFLLEEIHFLSGKEKTQTELGYTLDALANENKKIIFTSSLAPKDIPRISRELTSRLTSGLISTIEKPDYGTRVNILKNKALEKNIILSEEITDFVACRLKRDVRQMESALNSMKAKSELLKERIDLDLAREVVNCLVTTESTISTEDVKKLVAKYYNVDPELIRSKSRKKIFSCPRNICAYLSRRYTDDTLEEIGRSINRSHSTVLYACELMERNIRKDNKIKRQVNFLAEKLKDAAK